MRRSTRRKTWGFLLGVLFCAGFACSGGHTMALDNSDSGRTVTVSAGDELDVTLGAIGNQGDPSVSSTVIEYEGSSLVGPSNPGGPTFRYKFTAVRQGQAVITIPFLGPVERDPFVLDVNVE
jgi:hypothetical protein